MMKRALKVTGIVFGVLFALIAIWWFNAAVYPFTSKSPNFKDVETEFAKLQFPSDWKEISSSENKGIAGRQCDYFDASGCFHKSKTFKIPMNATKDNVKAVLEKAGCGSVSVVEDTKKDELEKSYNFRCSVGYEGVYLVGTYEGPEDESYFSATTN